MGKGARTRRRREKEDFAFAAAVAKRSGGFADPKVGAVEVPNTAEGTEEAIAEILEVAREQGCTCTARVRFEVLGENPALNSRVGAAHIVHENHCPLLRSVQEGSR